MIREIIETQQHATRRCCELIAKLYLKLVWQQYQ
jgi:hypothetical protein